MNIVSDTKENEPPQMATELSEQRDSRPFLYS